MAHTKMNYRRMALVGLISLVALALVGCAKKDSVTAAGGTAQVDRYFKPGSGQVAPTWKLKTPDGREVSSTEFAGKVIVLDVWATWCPPCRAEIPGYIALQEKFRDKGLVVIGLSVDEDLAALKQFVVSQKINYPVVIADQAVQDGLGGIEALPTTFVIDRTGKVVLKKIGSAPHEAVEAAIQRYL